MAGGGEVGGGGVGFGGGDRRDSGLVVDLEFAEAMQGFRRRCDGAVLIEEI